MEDVHQAQAKTQQSVEELGLSLKGVKVGVEEINEKLDSLKGEKDKNKSEEALQKLAKSLRGKGTFRKSHIQFHFQPSGVKK